MELSESTTPSSGVKGASTTKDAQVESKLNGELGKVSEAEQLRALYRQVLKFYKDNEGKSIQVPYQERLRLVALTQQVSHGSYAPDKAPPLGALDVIGKDRRNAWINLGDMAKEEAMRKFIEGVSNVMPHLKPYLEAHQKIEQEKREEEERSRLAEMELTDREKASLEAARLAEAERIRQEEQRRQIQDALNRQTFTQFKAYAEKQFPNNPDQQAVLIRQLQEQHYYQYMQQIYQQQMESHASETLANEAGVEAKMADLNISNSPNDSGIGTITGSRPSVDDNDDDESHDGEDDDDDNEDDDENESDVGDFLGEDISPASMWTKKELSEFKASIRAEGGDSIIKVGHGETVTVRVPTHEDGSAIFWEFATDSYDIAFGLFFEWVKPEDENDVSVHISDSEDEDLDDEFEEPHDDEEAAAATTALVQKGPPTSVIVPIYRRDCHQEVYAGTHRYPGPGVYLLKFDNTYSLWRSKTLYYRVYYTK